MLAAAPAWFADNISLIAVGTLLVLTFLVVRMISKLTLRVALLVAIALVALFVSTNRASLQQCARTCHCQIADRPVTVPLCTPSLDI